MMQGSDYTSDVALSLRDLIVAFAIVGALATPFVANAQYARPGTVVPTVPQKPGASPPAPAAPATPARALSGAINPAAPFCFESIDQRDTALINALASNGLLCPTVAKTGVPVRLRATQGGELTGEESGTPTALHRAR